MMLVRCTGARVIHAGGAIASGSGLVLPGALLLVCVLGLLLLDRVFERLEYETFMLQPGA